MRGPRIAVITAGGALPTYALDALDSVAGSEGISVLNSIRGPRVRWLDRHAASGLLVALASRNQWTSPVPVGEGRLRIAERLDFAPVADGSHHVLPTEVVAHLRNGGFDAALHLGPPELRMPPPEDLPLPVLTLHIGEPGGFRAGPPGFWETLGRAHAMGQAVETAGTDAGEVLVVASAETKVFSHSYRATLAEAYRHSGLLLARAVVNVTTGVTPSVRNTGLRDDGDRDGRSGPTTGAVGRFLLAQSWRWLRRQVYGAVVEKQWQVSIAAAPPDPVAAVDRGALLPHHREWRTLRAGRRYVFFADPFLSEDPPGILVEALRATTGRGEIVLVDGDQHRRVSPTGGHFSYPATVRVDGRQFVVPETASWSPVSRYVLEDGELRPVAPLDVGPDPRVVDPTLLEHDGSLYLFGNEQDTGSGALHVWVADSIEAPFRRHPLSPVLISPRGARMAGNFLRTDGALIRFGQDFCSGYGDGLFCYEVDELSPTAFREHLIGEVRFTDRRGPHTLNVANGQMVFDWYQDAFAPLAGVRRVLAVLGRDRRPGLGTAVADPRTGTVDDVPGRVAS